MDIEQKLDAYKAQVQQCRLVTSSARTQAKIYKEQLGAIQEAARDVFAFAQLGDIVATTPEGAQVLEALISAANLPTIQIAVADLEAGAA